MFGWLKPVFYYKWKYKNLLANDTRSNLSKYNPFKSEKKRWGVGNSSHADAVDTAISANSKIPDFIYYKNLQAKSLSYAQTKENEQWARWSSNGVKRLGYAKAIQEMAKKHINQAKFDEAKQDCIRQLNDHLSLIKDLEQDVAKDTNEYDNLLNSLQEETAALKTLIPQIEILLSLPTDRENDFWKEFDKLCTEVETFCASNPSLGEIIQPPLKYNMLNRSNFTNADLYCSYVNDLARMISLATHKLNKYPFNATSVNQNTARNNPPRYTK